jgi:hypothetical protein
LTHYAKAAGIMEFKAHRKHFLLAAPLAAVTAVTITACGGGSAPAFAQGAAPGHWTQTEVSEFVAGSGSGNGNSTDSCIAGYFERDMSFGNAMAIGMVSSDNNMSPSQIGTALVAKYGTAEGDAIYSQYQQVISDSTINCGN